MLITNGQIRSYEEYPNIYLFVDLVGFPLLALIHHTTLTEDMSVDDLIFPVQFSWTMRNPYQAIYQMGSHLPINTGFSSN